VILVDFFIHNLIGRTMLGYFLIFSVPTIVPFLFVKLVGFKGLRHLFSYEPKQSIIHGLDPRLKVTYPVLIGILSIFLNWDFVYYLVGFTLIPWMFLRPSPARSRVIITMAGVPVIGAIWSQGLFHTEGNSIQHLIVIFPWTLSWLGTPGLSSTGLLYGVQQSGRTLAGVLAALILLFTTTPSEVVWAFYKFRLPAAAGLAFSAALRFLPQMLERMTVLLQVVQVRGYDLSIPRRHDLSAWPGYIKRVFVCIPVITVPLLIGALRNTSVMAMVVDARAFGSHNIRSTLKEHQITLADDIALGALAAVTLAVILLVALHIGNRLIGITFGADDVEFRMLQQAESYTLSYSECYKLFEVLYQRREDLYRRMSREQQTEGPTPLHLEEPNITYTVNDESLSVSSWEKPESDP